MNKLTKSLKQAILSLNIKDGMTLSFHHHLRNGDYVINLVMQEIAELGIKDICIQASSVFDCHYPLVELMRSGVVSSIETGYMNGRVAEAISRGEMQKPVVFRSHGSRAAKIDSGEIEIDVAFIAAPSSDCMGNANGSHGKSACGSLGYALPDVKRAKKVVLISDNIMPYPLSPASIRENDVDIVVELDKIGNPSGIVSGTTQMTRDPVQLKIASLASRAIIASGLVKEGFSFQTGAGGASLAVSQFIKEYLREKQIQGSFALGGITKYMVDMLNEGYFKSIMDVQCFDLAAVDSIRNNPRHIEISASQYASPKAKSCAAKNLDIVVLGATEIDESFNVNVHTDSSGIIKGGSGGHTDTASGAKLSVIAAPLFRARLPIILDKIWCKSTPGTAVDMLVTQRGIAVNDRNPELKGRLLDAKLPVLSIGELKQLAQGYTGKPKALDIPERVIGLVEGLDGEIIDRLYKIDE